MVGTVGKDRPQPRSECSLDILVPQAVQTAILWHSPANMCSSFVHDDDEVLDGLPGGCSDLRLRANSG